MTLLNKAVWALTLASTTTLLGCGGGAPAECGPAECADVCAKEAPAPAPAPDAAPSAGTGVDLNGFESSLLQPLLDDLRGGVRPFGDEGIGLCTGEKECDKYLGLTHSDPLPPGKHMVKAELLVPNIGPPGTWKVTFDPECTTTRVTAIVSLKTGSVYQRVTLWPTSM